MNRGMSAVSAVSAVSAASLLALALLVAPACSLRERPKAETHDGAAPESSDGRAKLAPDPDARPRPVPTPDAHPAKPGTPVCPAPCPPQQDCVAVFPNTTAGICLRPCSSGCGPCGGGPGWSSCSQCQVKIAGIDYCMDFCWWKGDSMPCADPVNQACVDAYSIPNGLLQPGYPGSRVCVPK